MSISNTHEFIELKHKDGKVANVIVEEFTDFYFDHGWRFVRYVPNHEVNFCDVIERSERLGNWILRNSSSDPFRPIEVYTTSEGESYFYEAPEIY